MKHLRRIQLEINKDNYAGGKLVRATVNFDDGSTFAKDIRVVDDDSVAFFDHLIDALGYELKAFVKHEKELGKSQERLGLVEMAQLVDAAYRKPRDAK